MESGEDDDDEAEKDKKNNNDTANTTFVNPSQLESEMVEFDLFVKCKDHWLRNDQSLYTQRLNSIPEVERVDNLWITPTKDYQVGSLLPTKIKFKTKFGQKCKADTSFRLNIWKTLEFEETCPNTQE